MSDRAVRTECGVNLVTRALVFQDGHLLVSRWKGMYCFPVGGKIELGETLEQSLLREVFEETRVAADVRRLVYFNENFFEDRNGRPVHELGWYFWVEPTRPIGGVGEIIPHPDSQHLRLEYVALDRLSAANLVPLFLVRYLPDDFGGTFDHCPRHIVSVEGRGRVSEIREVTWKEQPGQSGG